MKINKRIMYEIQVAGIAIDVDPSTVRVIDFSSFSIEDARAVGAAILRAAEAAEQLAAGQTQTVLDLEAANVPTGTERAL